MTELTDAHIEAITGAAVGHVRETRLATMVECAKLVCCWCGPLEHDKRKAPLMLGAPGCFDHEINGHTNQGCHALRIWREMAREYGLAEVKARSPRGWRET